MIDCINVKLRSNCSTNQPQFNACNVITQRTYVFITHKILHFMHTASQVHVQLKSVKADH